MNNFNEMNNRSILLSVAFTTMMLLNLSTASASLDSTKIYFRQAYQELKNMLEEKQPVSFERAVFISENAYHDNKYSYENFQQSIDAHLYCIKKLIQANDKGDSIDFSVKVNANGRFKLDDIRYLPKEKKELYRKTLTNWAIFTYLTDTTVVFPFYHTPFTYATHDPFGMQDWSNSQVINLLASKEQKGNCFALTGLFKILSDRLNSGARICTAPQHIYIQHQDHKGDYYNVELATAGHPGDGIIQVLTYTTSDAIKNGIALRSYDEKQSIGLCIINLAKSYEHKFQTKEDEFILKCAELVLKHDSLNLNALLLKQQVLDARITSYAAKNNISNINHLKQDPEISTTVAGLEKHLALLYRLGYRQMPMDMQLMVRNGFSNDHNGSILTNKNPDPFTTIQPKEEDDAQYWTLSGGLFQEVFEQKELEPYGHFTFKTATGKITAIDTASRTGPLIDPVAFAYDFGARMYDATTGIFISVDPMAHMRVSWSPYNFCRNNPILNVDPTGALDNPIYDKEGEFLGTDDKGLQGEAIVMDKKDFRQGMSHEDALAKGTLRSELPMVHNQGFYDKIDNHFTGLPNRPDYDGVVTIQEGIAWAKNHPNLRATPDDVNYSNATASDALYLDASKMDFGRLSISDFKKVGVEQGVNLLNFVSSNPRSRFTTYALGRTRMTLVSKALGGMVTVSNGAWNAYDWDYGGNLMRETLIFGERTIKGLNDSHGFPIKVYGTGLLNK